MALQAKMVGTFTVVENGNKAEVNFGFDSTSEITEHTTYRLKIPAATVDYAVQFGTVGPAKRLFIDPASRVTIKVENIADTGFVIDGPTMLSGEVSSVFITTTAVEVLVKFSVSE